VFCDLHTHSLFSDGTDTPEEIVARAEALGLGAVALTDHNTTAGVSRFLAAGVGKPIKCVPGVEISTEFQGKEVHILGLFLTESMALQVEELVGPFRQRKEQSNAELAARLNQAGYHLDYPAMRSAARGSVNRAHFAQELIRLGYVSSKNDAFDTILSPDGPFYQPPERLESVKTVAFLQEIGAVSVLAHPYLKLSPDTVEALLSQAVPEGLVGMEVLYSEYTPEQTTLAAETARRFGLLPSGGSDYHGTIKEYISLGTGRGNLKVPMAYLEALASAGTKGAIL
jgi:predicted metal-dependent phosphoesterase TrpH